MVESTKLISVRRFIRLYADIMHQMTAVSTASNIPDTSNTDVESAELPLHASIIIDGYGSGHSSDSSSCSGRSIHNSRYYRALYRAHGFYGYEELCTLYSYMSYALYIAIGIMYSI